jgi:hypothetical protein
MDLDHVEIFGSPTLPLAFGPCAGGLTTCPTQLPVFTEVRVSLSIDETLGWVLPVQFCIDQLLTAEEVIGKLADAFWFLDAWSLVHDYEGREQLRTKCFQAECPVKSPSKYTVQ